MDALREQGMSLRIHEVFETEQSELADHTTRVATQETGPLVWARLRRGLLICIGCGCVLLGFTMMLTLVRPETLIKLSTVELASIVGFVVFPAATMFAVRYDRLVVQRCQIASEATSVQAEINPDETVEAQEAERRTHLAHERGGRVVLHQRSAEITAIETPAA